MEVNHHKTELIRKLGPVNILSVKEAVLSLSEDQWDTKSDYEANYNKEQAALRQVKHIILKFANKQKDPIQYFTLPRWQEWKNHLLPIMEQATKAYGYQKGFFPKVMFARMPPQSFIPPHTDGGAKGYVPHKIHIPISTNPEAYFFLDDQKFHFEEGMAYEVNNGLKHSVINNGRTDRIHLIFEYLDAVIQPEEIAKQLEEIAPS